jgi:hypothetical protein
VVGALEGELDVRDVVARRREPLLEAHGDRAGDRGGADDARELGAVVDDRVVGEERCDRLGLVLVEVQAVRVDQLLDLVPVDEVLQLHEI